MRRRPTAERVHVSVGEEERMVAVTTLKKGRGEEEGGEGAVLRAHSSYVRMERKGKERKVK